MNRSIRWAALAGAVMLTGVLQACAPTLPLAIKPVGCTVADNTLALRCAAPQAVGSGISFSDVINIGREDRKALRECQVHLQLALNLLKECRTAVQDYSTLVDGVNERLRSQGR